MHGPQRTQLQTQVPYQPSLPPLPQSFSFHSNNNNNDHDNNHHHHRQKHNFYNSHLTIIPSFEQQQ